MLNKTPSNYRLALDKVRRTRAEYNRTLQALSTILTGINTGLIHGRKEKGLLEKVKPTIALLTSQNLAMVKAEWEFNQLRKWGLLKNE